MRDGQDSEADTVAGRTLRPNKRLSNISACVGFGLLLSWLFSQISFEGIIKQTLASQQAPHDTMILASTLAIAALSCALGLSRKAMAAFRAKVLGGFVSTVIVVALAIASVFVVGFTASTPRLVSAACGAISGIAFTLLLFSWIQIVSEFDPKDTGGTILSSLAVLFVTLFAILLVNNDKAILVLENSFLLISMLLLFYLKKSLGVESSPPDESAGEDTPLPSPVRKAAIFAFVSGFIGMFVWTYVIKAYEDAFVLELFSTGLAAYSYGISGLCVVVAVFVVNAISKKNGFFVLNAHRITLMSLILSLGFALVGNSFIFPAYTLSHLAFFMSQTVVLIVVFLASYLFNESSHLYAGNVIGSQYFGYFCGFLFFLIGEDFLKFSPLSPLALLTCLLACCVAFLFVFTEADIKMVEHVSARVPNSDVPDSENVLALACKSIQGQYGLTEREREILEMLARGKNAVTIAEDLVVSYGTVKSHKHNIYTKLDIHTQQDLLRFVERRAKAAGNADSGTPGSPNASRAFGTGGAGAVSDEPGGRKRHFGQDA